MRDAQDPLTGAVIGAAIHVHQQLGVGLLESAYDESLAWVLTRAGMQIRRQVEVPVVFEGHRLGPAFRIDLLVAEQVVVEIKSVVRILPVHEAQLRTYLRLSGLKTGLLLNFLVPVMKDGIRRMSM
jgi:GxxExxY protein